jgi:hypothetical protein
MHLVSVIQLEKRNCETTSQVNSEETVAFAWIHTFQDTFQTLRTDMRLLRYSTKCVGQNASGSSHPTWKPKLRDDVASKLWGNCLICLSKASSKHSEILQTAMRLSRFPTKCVGHNGFSKSSRSILMSAWRVLCSFLATTIQHLAFLPSHCFSYILVTL